jgi:putative membrane protein
MRWVTLAFWIGGLALVATLVYLADARAVVRSATAVGAGFVGVVAIRIVLLYIDAHSWRWLLRPRLRPSIHSAAFQRWIGESVSVLLPLAVIGGELVRVRLAILFGIAAAPAFASIVMDAVVAAVSQLLFFALGVALYAGLATGRHAALVQPIALGGVALLLAIAAMWIAIRGGVLGRFAGLVRGTLAGERAEWLADAMHSVDRHIGEIADDRAAFARAVAWRLLGWLLGAAEIWWILSWLGHPVGIAEALMLDALTAAVRTAFFFIPGGLGVQEGALLVLGATLGLGSETMLAVALVKRARELLVSVPGLLAWQTAEVRARRR